MRRLALLLALAGALGCALSGCKSEAGQATEVLLEVDAEPGVRARLAKLSIDIRGGAADAAYADYRGEPASELEAPPLPLHIALVPRGGDDTRRYQVTIGAHAADGSVVAEARVIGGYVPGSIRFARLVLEEACIGVKCGGSDEAPLTCSGGMCVAPHADASGFSSDRKAPTLILQDAVTAPATDAGAPDATSPVSRDAGGDGGRADGGGPGDSGPGDSGAAAGPDAANDAAPAQGTCTLGSSRLPCLLGS